MDNVKDNPGTRNSSTPLKKTQPRAMQQCRVFLHNTEELSVQLLNIVKHCTLPGFLRQYRKIASAPAFLNNVEELQMPGFSPTILKNCTCQGFLR